MGNQGCTVMATVHYPEVKLTMMIIQFYVAQSSQLKKEDMETKLWLESDLSHLLNVYCLSLAFKVELTSYKLKPETEFLGGCVLE